MCPQCKEPHNLSQCPRWRVRGVGELALLGALAWAGSVAAVGWWAYGAGKDAEIASHAREKAAAQQATEAATAAIADSLSKLKVKHVTIRQELEREVQTREVFRECRSGPDAVRMLNATIAGRSAVAGELPASGPAE